MTQPAVGNVFGEQSQRDRDIVADLLHAMSQPLTALECGLELALRTDKTAAQLRARLKTALETARVLHQRLVESQVVHQAGDPGDTSHPVTVETLLNQLREDFLPVARSARIKLAVGCEPALVHGDQSRLRKGFFHLLEFLLRICRANGNVRLCAHTLSLTAFEVDFSSDALITEATQQFSLTADLDLRIARRSFQAAGGDLVLSCSSGKVTGHVRLILAN